MKLNRVFDYFSLQVILLECCSAVLFQIGGTAESCVATGSRQRRLPQLCGLKKSLHFKFTVKVRSGEGKKNPQPRKKKNPFCRDKIIEVSRLGSWRDAELFDGTQALCCGHLLGCSISVAGVRHCGLPSSCAWQWAPRMV